MKNQSNQSAIIVLSVIFLQLQFAYSQFIQEESISKKEDTLVFQDKSAQNQRFQIKLLKARHFENVGEKLQEFQQIKNNQNIVGNNKFQISKLQKKKIKIIHCQNKESSEEFQIRICEAKDYEEYVEKCYINQREIVPLTNQTSNIYRIWVKDYATKVNSKFLSYIINISLQHKFQFLQPEDYAQLIENLTPNIILIKKTLTSKDYHYVIFNQTWANDLSKIINIPQAFIDSNNSKVLHQILAHHQNNSKQNVSVSSYSGDVASQFHLYYSRIREEHCIDLTDYDYNPQSFQNSICFILYVIGEYLIAIVCASLFIGTYFYMYLMQRNYIQVTLIHRILPLLFKFRMLSAIIMILDYQSCPYNELYKRQYLMMAYIAVNLIYRMLMMINQILLAKGFLLRDLECQDYRQIGLFSMFIYATASLELFLCFNQKLKSDESNLAVILNVTSQIGYIIAAVVVAFFGIQLERDVLQYMDNNYYNASVTQRLLMSFKLDKLLYQRLAFFVYIICKWALKFTQHLIDHQEPQYQKISQLNIANDTVDLVFLIVTFKYTKPQFTDTMLLHIPRNGGLGSMIEMEHRASQVIPQILQCELQYEINETEQQKTISLSTQQNSIEEIDTDQLYKDTLRSQNDDMIRSIPIVLLNPVDYQDNMNHQEVQIEVLSKLQLMKPEQIQESLNHNQQSNSQSMLLQDLNQSQLTTRNYENVFLDSTRELNLIEQEVYQQLNLELRNEFMSDSHGILDSSDSI